jgi:hypothetical protein
MEVSSAFSCTTSSSATCSMRATMLLTPEPGMAPLPTTDAASAVAGPVTAEDSADAEDLAATNGDLA